MMMIDSISGTEAKYLSQQACTMCLTTLLSMLPLQVQTPGLTDCVSELPDSIASIAVTACIALGLSSRFLNQKSTSWRYGWVAFGVCPSLQRPLSHERSVPIRNGRT